jgi:RNA polymerase sigma-70 factor, ECF subfamily
MPSFEEVFVAEYSRLVAELYALTGSLAEAEDVVAEAFARAWPRWSRLSGYDEPAAWLRRVAINLATSRWRRVRRLVGLGNREVEAAPPPSEDTVELISALAKLPFVMREAVVLHHLSGLPVDEVARITGVPPSTAKSRLRRGRAKLAEFLADTVEVPR